MKPFVFELPKTLSYRRRSGVWLPGGNYGGIGTLVLTTVAEKSFNIAEDVYGVEEIRPDQHSCRCFILVKFTDDAQDQPYRVRVGAMARCSCEAGEKGFRRSSCKHVDSLAHLITCDKLPPTPTQFGS